MTVSGECFVRKSVKVPDLTEGTVVHFCDNAPNAVSRFGLCKNLHGTFRQYYFFSKHWNKYFNQKCIDMVPLLNVVSRQEHLWPNNLLASLTFYNSKEIMSWRNSVKFPITSHERTLKRWVSCLNLLFMFLCCCFLAPQLYRLISPNMFSNCAMT